MDNGWYNLRMKFSWAENKKLIRETVSPAFVPFGFANPGISMWRWRETFVDVLHFYNSSKTTDFAIELGCHPRKISSPHPLPWVCIFRSRIHYPDKSICYGSMFKSKDSIEQQKEMLMEITPFVCDHALAWWSKFSTIEKAIELLLESSETELDGLTDARKGSVSFNQNLEMLRSLC